MENFSTPSRATLPWIANLATLAVVVAAIGWSGEQRPDVSTAAASAALPTATQTAPVTAQAQDAQMGAKPGQWPVKVPSPPIDGLQAVGYTPGQTP